MAQELKIYYSPSPHCTNVYYLKDDVDVVLTKKDMEIFNLKKELSYIKEDSTFDRDKHKDLLKSKDEEIRRLNRVLWVTRTAWAKSEKDRWDAHVDCGNKRNRKDPAFVKTGKLLEVSGWRKLWADNERKCRQRADWFR